MFTNVGVSNKVLVDVDNLMDSFVAVLPKSPIRLRSHLPSPLLPYPFRIYNGSLASPNVRQSISYFSVLWKCCRPKHNLGTNHFHILEEWGTNEHLTNLTLRTSSLFWIWDQIWKMIVVLRPKDSPRVEALWSNWSHISQQNH